MTSLVLHNEAEDNLILQHHEECSPRPDGTESCLRGDYKEWTSAPPAAKTKIAPGDFLSVGTIGELGFFGFLGYSHWGWVYFSYEKNPAVEIQIFVRLKKDYVHAEMGLYDVHSSNDAGGKSMPHGSRLECVNEDYKGLTSKIDLYAPESTWWAAKPASPSVEMSGQTEVMKSLLDTGLQTLITACFVVPGFGEVAIGLTAFEGLFHVFDSVTQSASKSNMVHFGECLKACEKAIEKKEMKDLKEKLDKVATEYNNSDAGFNYRISSIVGRCKESYNTNKGTIFLDDNLCKDLDLCFEFLQPIVQSSGDFQTKLTAVINTNAEGDTSDVSKARLSLGFSAISMTINAFAYGSMLSELAKTDLAHYNPQIRNVFNIFDPEHAVLYLTSQRDALRKQNVLSRATQQRIVDIILYEATTMGTSLMGDILNTHVKLKDYSIAQSAWGPGTVKEGNSILEKHQMTPQTLFEKGKPYYWERTDGMPRKGRAAYAEYRDYIKGQVKTDVDSFVESQITSLEEAAIPYMARLHRPGIPGEEKRPVVSFMHEQSAGTVPPVYYYRYVQYGYRFRNVNGEGDIRWSLDPLNEIKWKSTSEGVTTKYFGIAGCTIIIPKDPWLVKTKSLNEKANKLANTLTKEHAKPPTNRRVVYRRLCTESKIPEHPDLSLKVELIKELGNNDDDTFQDLWGEDLLTTKQ